MSYASPRRLLVSVAIVLGVAACSGGSDSPTAPTPPPPVQIAGGWSGTFESSTYTAEAIGMDLTQVGSAISGTWAMASGVRAFGNVSGTVSTSQFTGTITYNYSGGPTCSGSFSGTANASRLEWSSPGFATGDCGLASPGNPLNVRFVVQRR